MVAPVRTGILSLGLSLLLIALLRSHPAVAFYIRVDAHGEECFFEQGLMGAMMTLSFEVTQGGFLDVDVNITAPDNSTLYYGVRETSGRYAFITYENGPYKFCFSNRMSTLTPKTVMFTVDVARLSQPDEDSSRTKLEETIKELAVAIMAVKHEQEHMEVRERIHRAINEDTNRRVVLWSFFEAAVLLVMTIGQIYYLKSFFHVRRMV